MFWYRNRLPPHLPKPGARLNRGLLFALKLLLPDYRIFCGFAPFFALKIRRWPNVPKINERLMNSPFHTLSAAHKLWE
jgi:hypothetical protein